MQMDELSSIKSSMSYKRVIFQNYIILNLVFSSNLCKRIQKIKVTNVATNQHLYFTEQFKPDIPYVFQLWPIRPKSFVTLILMLANDEGEILCEGTFSTKLEADQKFVNLSNRNGNLMKNIKATLKYKKCIQKMINQKIKQKQKAQKLKIQNQTNNVLEGRLKTLNSQIDVYLHSEKKQAKSYQKYLAQSNLFIQNLQKNNQANVGKIVRQEIDHSKNNYRRIGRIKTNPASSNHTNNASSMNTNSLASRNSLKLEKSNLKRLSNSSFDYDYLTPIVNKVNQVNQVNKKIKPTSTSSKNNLNNHSLQKQSKSLSKPKLKKRNLSTYESLLDQKTRKLNCVKQQTLERKKKIKQKRKKSEKMIEKKVQIQEDEQNLPKSLKRNLNLDKNDITIRKSRQLIKMPSQQNSDDEKQKQVLTKDLQKKQKKIEKAQDYANLQKELYQMHISQLSFQPYNQIPFDDELSIQIFNSSQQTTYFFDLYQLQADLYSCKDIKCYLPQIKSDNTINIKIINSSTEDQLGKMSIVLSQLLNKNLNQAKYKHFILKQKEIIGHVILSYEIYNIKELKKLQQKNKITKVEQELPNNHPQIMEKISININEVGNKIQRRKLVEKDNEKNSKNQKN